ncbi:hypothetical protein CK203_046109 [Vitis vinifera]|uniref:RNase H type-1 domain-containing protein n=1 Tax=Vitis vinifera TaxID=29760 RepID=A0A438HP01_VITVI|nr:hypothetical protein CK203_046109 [Vitis vinifera]
MTLTLCVVTKKLRPCFQAHQVTILTNHPLKVTLHKPDLSGRMMKWAIELSEYDIQYKPHLSLKGQILANFIVKLPKKWVQTNTINHWWILHVNRASRVLEAGEVEYEAIIVGLELALALAASKVEIGSDSQLVVEQIQQEYEAKDERMSCHLNGVESCLAKLSDWRVKCIPHEENRKADALPMPSIALERVYDVAHASEWWMHPIANYLRTDEVSEDGKQAYKLRFQATRFTLINDQLYRQSFGRPYLKCLTNSKAQYVLA